MKIENLREWLLVKSGEVDTAINRPATIGELMAVVQHIIKELEGEN